MNSVPLWEGLDSSMKETEAERRAQRSRLVANQAPATEIGWHGVRYSDPLRDRGGFIRFDDTEARKPTVRRFGRSDRRAQRCVGRPTAPKPFGAKHQTFLHSAAYAPWLSNPGCSWALPALRVSPAG